MRTLWRVVTVLTLSTLVLYAGYHWWNAWLRGDAAYSRAAHAITALTVGVVLTVLVLAALRWVDRRPAADIGLVRARAVPQFGHGFLLWLVPALATLTLFAVIGVVAVKVHVPLPQLAWIIAVQLVLVFALEAFPEELVFRGYLQTNLADRLGPRTAVIGQAVLFTLAALALRGYHGPGEMLRFLAFGLVAGYVRQVTDSIWTGVGMHVSFQTMGQLLLMSQVTAVSLTPVGSWAEALIIGAVPFTVVVLAIRSRTQPKNQVPTAGSSSPT